MSAFWSDLKRRKALSTVFVVAFLAQLLPALAGMGALAVVLMAVGLAIGVCLPANRTAPWDYLRLPVVFIAAAASVLTIYSLPFTHFNPDINWSIQRGLGYGFPPPGEVDPWYLLLFVPAAEAVVSFFVLLLGYGVSQAFE